MQFLELKILETRLYGIIRGAGYPKKDFGKRHDVIFRYSKANSYIFNLERKKNEDRISKNFTSIL
jgi:hypothetical protein